MIASVRFLRHIRINILPRGEQTYVFLDHLDKFKFIFLKLLFYVNSTIMKGEYRASQRGLYYIRSWELYTADVNRVADVVTHFDCNVILDISWQSNF